MEKRFLTDFKKMLNPAQLDAVMSIDGPVLVVAGAGTGKTRVIEYRCLYMIKKGIAPEHILLLTFTRKAAREMLGRASMHDAKCRKIEGGTFHSFAYHIIKKYKKVLGFVDNISFIDEADSADILHLLSARLGFLREKIRFPKRDTLRSILSMAINRNQGIKDVLIRDYPHFLTWASRLEKLQKKYMEFKIARNLIDYDDMLIYLKFLLKDPAINQRVSGQFQYVMVDEFQDTNKIQADIIYLLAKSHHNCMAVGDDTQSIYSFRGAHYKNMFDFPKKFPDTKIIKLEYNYRSTQPILDVANAIIEGEQEKYEKVLFTTCAGDEKPTLSFFKDAYHEAQWLAARIKEYRDGGLPLSSMGILYRSNFLSLPIQLELSKLNIPFAVFGGIKFIETAHIKDVLSFLKVHHNPLDDLSMMRILMLMEGIGPRTAEKIKDIMIDSRKEVVNKIPKDMVKNPLVNKELVELIELFAELRKTPQIQKKVKKIISFYTPILKKKFDDYPAREDDLKVFMEISSSYVSLEQFLVDFVAIESPERSVVDIEGKREDERPVTLSTIHSAKGLEWEVVFITGLVDGSLPVSYALNIPEATEEERRLLYVAVTRAKRHLHLSMHNEGRNGGMSGLNRLSRFINESRVLEKLDSDYSWIKQQQEEELLLDDDRDFGMSKEDLYDKMIQYFQTGDAEDYF